MSIASRIRRQHLNVEFAIWRNEEAWYWLLINSSGEGGTIGASGDESQAMRDACLSIEEKLAAA